VRSGKHVEVLTDEQKATTVGFLASAIGWFSEQGITCRRVLSDNGSAYRSGDWRKACRALDLKPICTRPHTPQTNGKAERFIKPQASAQQWTFLAEWAYVIAYQTSDERNRWLPRDLRIDSGIRCHMALGDLSPQQSLQRLLIDK
jgi:transposase InsO family protein